MERQGDEIALLAHLLVVGDEVLADLVGKGLVPVHPAHQRVQFIRAVTQGVQAADKASHAGAQNHVDRNLLLLQILDYGHVRSSLGPAAAEHEGDSRTLFLPADVFHLFPYLDEDDGVFGRIAAGGCKTHALSLTPSGISVA